MMNRRPFFGTLTSTVRFLVLALALLAPTALAQDPNACDEENDYPDVIVGDLHQTSSYGNVGDIWAYAVGTYSCNIGTCWLNWFQSTPEHPVISTNMYKYLDGRLTHVGQSWLKHGFFALSEELCETGCISTSGTHLGVNCADPYSSSLNGQQSNLGPKWDINPTTGAFTMPYSTQGWTGDTIYKRLQVHGADLDPALNPGARYWVEGHYVAADDHAAGKASNNASIREITVDPLDYDISLISSTIQQRSGIHAWPESEAGIKVARAAVVDHGGFNVAGSATPIGGGITHFEYAVQNLNCDRAGYGFRVKLPAGATVTNIGFHDVDYHSGSPWDASPWEMFHDEDTDEVVWHAKSTYAEDPEANALRWATMYNFWFDADVDTKNDYVYVDLFAPAAVGDPDFTTAWIIAPEPCNNDGTCDPNETCANCAADCVNDTACCGDDVCDPEETACNCQADCGLPPVTETACFDGIDDDCDNLADCDDLDCCMEAACLGGPDGDGDGTADCDCDDGNDQIWTTPSEVVDLYLDQDDVLGATLDWSPPVELGATSVEYETLRTTRPDGWEFESSCMGDMDPLDLTNNDSAGLGTRAVFYYLIRATNNCPGGIHKGTLGFSYIGERIGNPCP